MPDIGTGTITTTTIAGTTITTIADTITTIAGTIIVTGIAAAFAMVTCTGTAAMLIATATGMCAATTIIDSGGTRDRMSMTHGYLPPGR